MRYTSLYRLWQTGFAVPVLGMLITLCSVSHATPLPQQDEASNPQPAAAATIPAANLPGIPRLVHFSGVVKDGTGKPATGSASLVFSFYEQQQGGTAIWSEVQTVSLNKQGHYSVLLGASQANGLPSELFADGKPRWVGVQAQLPGVTENPRVLLAGVPYALEAADAQTLGGQPASAFVTKEALAAFTPQLLVQTSPSTNNQQAPPASGVTGSGKTNYLPLWTSTTQLGDSILYQSGGHLGIGTITPASALDVKGGATIRGLFSLPSGGKATAQAGFNSHPLDLAASAFNSGTNAAVNQTFQWQAEPVGNNTASPSGSLNLLFGQGTGSPAETGLSIASNGQITFASGQTFPGIGNGTITGVTAGAGLTGGGTTGNVTLSVDTTKVVTGLTAGTGLTGGGSGGNLTLSIDVTRIPQLNANNSFAGSQTVAGSLTAIGQISGSTASFTKTISAGGALLPPTGTSTYQQGYTSYPLDLQASSYDFQQGPITKDYRWQVEPTNNDTGLTSASLNLLYGSGGATPAETGISIAPNGGLTVPLLATPTLNATSVNSGNLFLNQPYGTIASPDLVIQADDDAQSRGIPHQLQIQGAANPTQQLLIGYLSDANTTSSGGLASIQATWTGYENTPLEVQPFGGCVCIRMGLSNSYNDYPLAIGQGQGGALADAWYTFSSRRWKTNIHTLPDALSKVEQLRGVSYDLKETGKHEIGVIAEEVGAVVPEVVTWEPNGKDARGVDYTRLTALLIEAVKQQQKQIDQQGAELHRAVRQINYQQALLRKQTSTVKALQTQLRTTNEGLRRVKHELTSTQPVMVAAK